MTRLRRLCVATAIAVAACEPAPPPPTDLGIPLALAQHRARTLADLRYDIRLEIPGDPGAPVSGRSLITFRWADPAGHPVVLDFKDPEARVRSLRVNGADASWTAANDHIVLPAAVMREGGVNEIDISYVAGDDALNRNDDFLYTLFVPDRAHFSLPVFDQPDLKARVSWRLKVPAGWQAVANGPSAEYSVLGDTKTVDFLESRPIPTYLFSFAAGRFSVEEEVVGRYFMRMYHRETDTATVARNRDEIFRLHGAALEWLEEYTGIPYPFQKFEFVLIPSFQYGGMEHPGQILYRQAGLMLDASATQSRILGRASVIAHETAHMWFGNLVTMQWFNDVWMKEVFANFMAAKIVRPSFPDIDHDLRFLTAHHPAAYAVDRTPGTHPIRQPLENLRFAGTLYGPIIYQKAPVVMRQLERRVGEEAFRAGLQDYLERYAYANASWPDLVTLLDARTPEDLAAWSRVWVEEAGRPRIVAERVGPDVRLRQEDPLEQGRVWPQRLELRVGSVEAHRAVPVDLDGREARVPGLGREAFILPNGSGLEYGGFVLDDASRSYLLAHVSELAPALVRGAAWVTLWEEALDGRVEPGVFLDVALDALQREDDELVLGRILDGVGTAYWRLLTPERRRALAPRLEDVLWREVAAAARPRTARAAFFAAYRAHALTDEGVTRLRRVWEGREELPDLPLSEPDRIALAEALALRGVHDAEAVLDAQEGRIENPDRLARFRFVRPALSADPAVRRAFFESLRDPGMRQREPWVLAGLRYLHHPLRAEASLPLVRPALEMLEEIQRTGDIFFPGRWLDAVLGGYNTPEAAAVVREYLDEHPELGERLRRKVLQASDLVFRAARIVYGDAG